MTKSKVMYDTMNFWIDSSIIGNPFSVLPYLGNIAEHRSDKLGYSCSGTLGDYTINCYQSGISLKGSLAKYYLPSNVFTLTRQTATEAFEKMSDELHFDMLSAKVTRTDISTIIPTKRTPTDYYSRLGNKPRFNRLFAHADTLYYNQQSKQLIFYDKTKEAHVKGAIIPTTLKGCNLLRYELRLLRNLPKALKMGSVTGATLTKSSIYHSLIKLWKDEFDTIKKINPISTMTDNIRTPKEAKEALFAMLLQKNGQDCIDNFLSDLKAASAFSDPKYYSRLKTELNKIFQAPKEERSDMIRELEQAISDVALYAR